MDWDVSGSGTPTLGSGQVGIDTDTRKVYYGATPTLVGTLDSTNNGSAGNPIKIALAADADAAAIQAIARKVQFSSTSQAPSENQRVITFTVRDSDEISGIGTVILDVDAVNDLPAVDLNAGVITLGTLTLKPDYLFIDLDAIDYDGVQAKDGVAFGTLAFEIKDYNADGQYDFGYYSDAPMGFQILYSVSAKP